MANETTDNQKLSFRVSTFMLIIFTVFSVSFTISGIISQISGGQDDLVAEQYARKNNDRKIMLEVKEVEEDLRKEIKELKETIKFYIENER